MGTVIAAIPSHNLIARLMQATGWLAIKSQQHRQLVHWATIKSEVKSTFTGAAVVAQWIEQSLSALEIPNP